MSSVLHSGKVGTIFHRMCKLKLFLDRECSYLLEFFFNFL